MTNKRFNSYCDNENIRIRIDDDIKNKEVFHIYFAELDDALYCKLKLNPILDLLNQLNDENEKLKRKNKFLKNQYERKDRQLHRTKKDIEKYTDYFMNELNWDCERIIKEVFK